MATLTRTVTEPAPDAHLYVASVAEEMRTRYLTAWDATMDRFPTSGVGSIPKKVRAALRDGAKDGWWTGFLQAAHLRATLQGTDAYMVWEDGTRSRVVDGG